MKSRKIISILLVLVMTASALGFSVFAADVTEQISVYGGENKTVDGNVTVANDYYAVYVCGGEAGAASVKVNGNVSLKSTDSYFDTTYVYAVGADSSEGTGSANITGNVSAECIGSATGVYSNQGNAVVGEDVSAKAAQFAAGIDVFNGTAEIGGNLSAEAPTAYGAQVYSGTTQTTTVNGAITATGKDATGAELTLYGPDEGEPVPSLNFTAKNGITATQQEVAEKQYGVIGLVLTNGGGTITADITGDVVAESAIKNAIGISIGNGFMEEADATADGTNNVLIHGSLVSDGAGISKMIQPVDEDDESYVATTNVLIENVLDAKDAGVAIIRLPVIDEVSPSETEPETDINLTVWKINLNEDGNAAVIAEPVAILTPDGVDDSQGTEMTPATEFEKTINYIVKVEQPSEGGTIKAVKEDGSALEQSFDFDVAREGDKIYIDDSGLEDGYSIKAAYNGTDEKAALETDEDGNYYIVVPKGGGIDLSVELEKEEQDNPDNPDNSEVNIEIKDFKEQDESGYKEDKTFTADVSGMPEGAEIHWFVNGEDAGTGESITVEDPTEDYTVQAKVIDKDGNVLDESSTAKVKVRNGFFDKLEAFFLDLVEKILGKAIADFLSSIC